MANLLKIGSLGIPVFRWLDATNNFDKIYILDNLSKAEFLNSTGSIRGSNENCKQFIFKQINNSVFYLGIKKLLMVLGKFKFLEPFLHLFCLIFSKTLFKLSNFFKKYKKIENDIDLILSSYNDFDGSSFECLMLELINKKKKSKPIIRAYKEHRCRYNFFEKYSLKEANGVILPSLKNKFFFGKFYGIKFKNFRIADEDWRSYFFINSIFENVILKKRLKKINTPHVVILTGVATYKREKRSGLRYNYLSLIECLLKQGIKVTLHAKKIVSNREENICSPDNPYIKLQKKYGRLFRIAQSLNFDKNPINSYYTLSSYDAGVLHSINFDEDKNIKKFSQMNIPHRFYNYIISGVIPLVQKGKMGDVEKLINKLKYGVIYKDIKSLRKQIVNFDFNKIDIKKVRDLTFKNYTRKVRELYDSIQKEKLEHDI